MEISNAHDIKPAWRWVLITTTASMILLGLVLVLSPRLGEMLFYIVYFGDLGPPDPFPDAARAYIRFTNGVLGSMLIGWMALILRLATIRPGKAAFSNWSAISLSIGLWFIIDTGFSLLNGVWGNALLNLLVAIGIFTPLLAGRTVMPAQPPRTPRDSFNAGG